MQLERMTDLQNAELVAGQRVDEFNSNADNLVVIGGIDDMSAIISRIGEQVAAVELAETAQQTDSADVSGEKKGFKEEMGKLVVRYAMRGEVKATFLGLTELAAGLNHPTTYITAVDDVLAVTRATAMRDLMDANKGPGGPLVNIVAADIALIDTAIGNFVVIRNKPTNIIKEKKADGTDLIQPEIDALKFFIGQELKLLKSYLTGTVNEPMIAEFELKAHAIVLGTRHNIVLVHLLKVENDEAIVDGEVVCERNGKSAVGDGFTDEYRIEGILSGAANFVVSAPGRVGVTQAIVVEKAKTVAVTIKLKLV